MRRFQKAGAHPCLHAESELQDVPVKESSTSLDAALGISRDVPGEGEWLQVRGNARSKRKVLRLTDRTQVRSR